MLGVRNSTRVFPWLALVGAMHSGCDSPPEENALCEGLVALGEEGVSAVVIGDDGLGVIAELSEDAERVSVRFCADPSCSSSRSVQIHDCGEEGCRGLDVAIGGDGHALIASRYLGSDELWLAHCLDQTCDTVELNVVVESRKSPSLAIGPDGLPLIAYGNLRLAICEDMGCSSAELVTLPYDKVGCGEPKLVIDAQGLPTIVAYTFDMAGDEHPYGYDNVSYDLFHCTDTRCAEFTTVAVHELGYWSDGTTSFMSDPDIALDQDGLPHIAIWDQDALELYSCGNESCSTVNHQRPVPSGVAWEGGGGFQLVVDSTGRPMMAYAGYQDPPTDEDGTHKGHTLWLASCTDSACSTVTTEELTPDPGDPCCVSMATGTNDDGLIVYNDHGQRWAQALGAGGCGP